MLLDERSPLLTSMPIDFGISPVGMATGIPNKSRFRVALLLAVIADALQIVIFPLFVEGAESPRLPTYWISVLGPFSLILSVGTGNSCLHFSPNPCQGSTWPLFGQSR
jgi:hypothetical protein